MAVPTFDKLLRPILELATRGPISRSSMNEAMISQFQLSPDEAGIRLASGGLKIQNRVGWAMTFLTKAALIEKVASKTYRATDAARQFLAAHPQKIRLADLQRIPGYEEAWEAGRQRRHANAGSKELPAVSVEDETATPEEIIERETKALNAIVRERLLRAILEQSPEFFERLVLQVLQAMGYGGKLATATEHLGQSGDEGIDGRINQDALGLDQILVQAKRYAPGNAIGRPAIQGFVGSLAGQGVSKGIFITTSSFADSAYDYVARGSSLKVVLIDGDMLIDLMLKHGIGTRVAHTYEVYELDQNYFDESE
jgi:restriction system protein